MQRGLDQITKCIKNSRGHILTNKEEMEIHFCSAGPELEAEGRTHGLTWGQIQKL